MSNVRRWSFYSLSQVAACHQLSEKAQFFSMYSHNIITSRSEPLQVCSDQMPDAYSGARVFASAPSLSPGGYLKRQKAVTCLFLLPQPLFMYCDWKYMQIPSALFNSFFSCMDLQTKTSNMNPCPVFLFLIKHSQVVQKLCFPNSSEELNCKTESLKQEGRWRILHSTFP